MPIKKCGQVSNGALQSGFTVFDSSSTVPTNMRYHITLTPAFNTVSVIRDFGTTTITGSTWTLDTFDPDATVLPALYTASSTSGSFYVNGDLTFTGTLIGTVPVSTLSSSVSTVNGVSCSLGGSCMVTASNPYALTLSDGYGSATTFNGSAAQTIHYLSTSQTGTQTIAGPISQSGSGGNTLSNTTAGSYIDVLGLSAPNLTSGTRFWFGRDNSSYDMAFLGYYYAGANSSSSQIGLGFYGTDRLLSIAVTGDVMIGTASDGGYKLSVSGVTKINSGSYGVGPTIIGDTYSQERYVNSDGTYGAMWRADGANFYMLLTDSGNSIGAWNGLRPFTVNLSTGNVSMSQNLAVGGSVTGLSWTATSDRREKRNIKTLDSKTALDRVMRLRSVTFTWNNSKLDQAKQTGWIAQEVERAGMGSSVSVKPGEIHHANGTTVKVDDFRSLKQNEMTAVLWAAVQEQQRQINQLRRQFKHKGAR